MNVKVPDNVSDGIDRVAEELGCSKTAVVIALLNEGSTLRAASCPKPPRNTPRPPRRGARLFRFPATEDFDWRLEPGGTRRSFR